MQENAFENVVCEKPAILCLPQCVYNGKIIRAMVMAHVTHPMNTWICCTKATIYRSVIPQCTVLKQKCAHLWDIGKYIQIDKWKINKHIHDTCSWTHKVCTAHLRRDHSGYERSQWETTLQPVEIIGTPAEVDRRFVTSSLTGWAHIKNGPCCVTGSFRWLSARKKYLHC